MAVFARFRFVLAWEERGKTRWMDLARKESDRNRVMSSFFNTALYATSSLACWFESLRSNAFLARHMWRLCSAQTVAPLWLDPSTLLGRMPTGHASASPQKSRTTSLGLSPLACIMHLNISRESGEGTYGFDLRSAGMCLHRSRHDNLVLQRHYISLGYDSCRSSVTIIPR